MLGRRLVSAGVIISVMIALVTLDHYLGLDDVVGRAGLVLCPLAMLVSMAFVDEMVNLFRQQCRGLPSFSNMVLSAISIGICGAPVLWRDYPVDCSIGLFGWMMIGMTFSIGMTVLLNIWRYGENSDATKICAYSALIHVQAILLFGFLIAHRLIFFDNTTGLLALLTLITTVKMSDAIAYFTGKSLGKHKLAPVLSPGKTVEGFVGSFIGAYFGACIIVYLVMPWFELQIDVPHWWVAMYAIAITIAAVVGDLAESMFKRDAKIKDSSSWLPGLGGVLDITDSLVYAGPLSFFLWVILE